MLDWPEIVLRLVAATLAGGTIGLNRDLHGKPIIGHLPIYVPAGAAASESITAGSTTPIRNRLSHSCHADFRLSGTSSK